MVQDEKTWTSRQIIDAVFNYNGGCSPGKADFLRTMGILVERQTPDEKDGIYVVRFPVQVVHHRLTAYWGDNSTVEQAVARSIQGSGYFTARQYGFIAVGPVKARHAPSREVEVFPRPEGF